MDLEVVAKCPDLSVRPVLVRLFIPETKGNLKMRFDSRNFMQQLHLRGNYHINALNEKSFQYSLNPNYKRCSTHSSPLG